MVTGASRTAVAGDRAGAESGAVKSESLGPAVLVGLLGRGIGRSRSPAMHEREGARLGLRLQYRLLDFDRLGLGPEALPEMILGAERLGYAGLNVTHPFKERVLRCLDELSEDAAAIGAVNTIVFAEGRRLGLNTDCFGFQESFRRGLPGAALDRVLQFGAGGAGMAVARALLQLGTGRLSICDLDHGKAEALCDSLRRQFGPDRAATVAAAEAAARQADGLVNATPLGMDKYPGSPVREEWLSARQWVADIVYFPEETTLVRQAERRGCATLRGAGMAVFQAAKAFELFTGRRPDPEQMRHHYAGAELVS